MKDALDVAIVTLLLYSAIKLVRETRAGQLIKGIILLVVLFLISSQFDLLMLNAILRAFLSSGIVIVVILFQPEIRKALEQVGHSKVAKSLASAVGVKDKEEGKAAARKAIEGVVDATQILQQLRMGALIVFERRPSWERSSPPALWWRPRPLPSSSPISSLTRPPSMMAA